MKAPSEQTRAWIYRILIAAGIVATAYGLITDEQVAVWLGLAASILNIMPAVNTTTKKIDSSSQDGANL